MNKIQENIDAAIVTHLHLDDAVQEVIDKQKPEIIVSNTGNNPFLEGGSLVMRKVDVYKVHRAALEAKIIAVHMEAVNHWTLSREELRSLLQRSYLLVPDDGESYTF